MAWRAILTGLAFYGKRKCGIHIAPNLPQFCLFIFRFCTIHPHPAEAIKFDGYPLPCIISTLFFQHKIYIRSEHSLHLHFRILMRITYDCSLVFPQRSLSCSIFHSDLFTRLLSVYAAWSEKTLPELHCDWLTKQDPGTCVPCEPKSRLTGSMTSGISAAVVKPCGGLPCLVLATLAYPKQP